MITILLVGFLISSILKSLTVFGVGTSDYNKDDFFELMSELIIPSLIIVYIVAFAINHQ